MSSNPVPELDLSQPSRIHIVGVGGGAMSAIATVLAALGHHVSGSDLNPSAAERLGALGMRVDLGHDAANVAGADRLAVSSAIRPDNPEVVAARRSGIPVLSRSDILTAITRLRRTVAVAGTHGKTTTASMLATILQAAGWDPSFIIGGDIVGTGSGAAWRPGQWLVVEADESDGTFLDLHVEAAVVTSVEADHLDHYGTFERLVEAFDRFLAGTPGPRVAWADDRTVAAVAGRARADTYGRSVGADYRIEDLVLGRFDSSFRLTRGTETVAQLRLRVPGAHNAANAAGAAVVSLRLGVPRAAVEAGLERFAGVARRFQLRGVVDGVSYVDDYAHNPGKVRAVLEAARAGGWSRVVCVFQPHRYSRTARLWKDFADSFGPADLLVVTDVYGAGEEPIAGVSGKLVVDAVLDSHPGRAVAYFPNRAELVAFLRARLRPGDLCLTLGAGDLTELPDQLMARPGAGA